MIKKLIEVALPLEAINKESAREKSIRHGHPSTLHLWWARRPLAAARAVIWASLVDDPSSHPEQFPTEEEQNAERQRLFAILEKLVVWENSNNEDILNQAKAEIMKSTNGNPPALLDPFAGGGSIPLEAQRLGLEAHAHDLNPVAVMINKAMIEIPPKFAGQPPVNPDAGALLKDGWQGAAGLAEDVRYYGEWMKQEAFKRIGHLYPKVKDENGQEHTVIAWIWARTVKCPNPACGCEMPLVRSFMLSKKKGKEAWFEPIYNNGQLSFKVHNSGKPDMEGTVSRKGAVCACCGNPVAFPYIREAGKAKKIGSKLCAIVAEGTNNRVYITPNAEHIVAAQVMKPDDFPHATIANNPRNFNTPIYGLSDFSDLFTNRQLTALTTFSELVGESQKKVVADGGSEEYGKAVSVYLAFVLDKAANLWSSLVSWMNDRGAFRETFARQAIPMVWDYAESNPFSTFGGNFSMFITRCVDVISFFHKVSQKGACNQVDAQSDCGLQDIMVSTDPPYYDNIGYADLSDFFYIWLRQALKTTYPELFRTMLVPKKEELVATPYRFEGSKAKAQSFFEDGMLQTCKQIYQYAREDVPVTIYYAYKQSDTNVADNTTASTGWETMLSAIIQAGFFITGTWPMKTESTGRSIAQRTNALASSIVLVCRKRPENAKQTTRRDFINTLKRELKPALQKLQASNIAPVDLAQSAIGPGMAVFSKYKQVLEANGRPMSVRSALQIINQELDSYFNEQDSGLDRESGFCVDLYSQVAFDNIKFGEADTLARAKNTSVDSMAAKGILYAQKGNVHLLKRPELPEQINPNEQTIWLLTQQLTYTMEKGGIEACAKVLSQRFGANAEQAKALAYRLYTTAERKGWAQEAYAYNSLVVAWQDIQTRAAQMQAAGSEAISLF